LDRRLPALSSWRGQDGGGDSHDRLLGAAPGFEAIELGLQIATFLFLCR
jgi:hypothetical protein